MPLTAALKPLFASDVRGRGEHLAKYNSVHLEDHGPEWAQFFVEGSYGDYEVSLVRSGLDEFELECTCPHYEQGNHCKHLWAAIRVAEKKRLFPDTGAVLGRGRSNKRPAGWQSLLGAASRPVVVDLERTLERPSRLHYLIDVSDERPTPSVLVYEQKLRKNGDWGAVSPLKTSLDHVQPTDPADQRAISCLRGNETAPDDFFTYYRSRYGPSTSEIEVELSAALIDVVAPALAATGRLRWTLSSELDGEDSSPLSWDDGPAWAFRLRVKRARGEQPMRVSGELIRDAETRPITDAVRVYASGLVLIDDRLARFDPPSDCRWVDTLVANEQLEVPAKDRDQFVEELWRHGAPPPIAGDKSLTTAGRLGEPSGRLVVHPADSRSRSAPRTLYASVAFDYPGHTAKPGSPTTAWPAPSDRGVLTRDPEAEAALLQRLTAFGLEPKATGYYGDTPPGHVQFAARDLPRMVETLVGEGWRVEAEGALVRRSGDVSVRVSSGVDWFDLEGGFDFDGVEASLPEVLSALQKGERYVQLGDGTKGLLPEEWLERYGPLADLASSTEGDKLRFRPGQALLLDAMLSAKSADASVQVDQKFAALRRRLASFSGVKPTQEPKPFHGELRDYQREGLGWLRFLEKFELGGCLADDMGLGKTVQVLALLADRARRQPKETPKRPTLIVAPKSLVYNWRAEAERFAPKLSAVEYTGRDRKQRVGDFAEHDLVLTTYGTLRLDAERLAGQSWDYAILDEAQAIKNASAQAAKAARLLDARHRLALSGTPIENHLGELWSLFDFLNPGLLGKSTAFKRLTKGDPEKNAEQLTALRQGLAPFLLRRTKTQVLPQLPKKSEQPLYCEHSPSERKLYKELLDHYRRSLTRRVEQDGLAKSKVHVLEALLRLRQAACHPGLIDPAKRDQPSAKLSLLQEQLDEALAEGHKALVFSQFTTLLGMVRDRLDKGGVTYEYLDGKTSNRQQCVDRFQTDPECRVFLVSLKAGGVGLNLTAADYVFLLDPWWNPAVESQAIDRAHRLGQDQPVFAYRLITRDTVEEKILELQSRKSGLAEAIVAENASLLGKLSAEDLQRLLS